MSSLFDKPARMLPADAAAVASRRLGDARTLADTGDDERAGGAMYSAGLAVEILLKGQLIRLHPILEQAGRPSDSSMARRHDLVWRHHDLGGLLGELPLLVSAVTQHDRRTGESAKATLRGICETWTIFARYSVISVSAGEASRFVGDVLFLERLLQ